MQDWPPSRKKGAIEPHRPRIWANQSTGESRTSGGLRKKWKKFRKNFSSGHMQAIWLRECPKWRNLRFQNSRKFLISKSKFDFWKELARADPEFAEPPERFPGPLRAISRRKWRSSKFGSSWILADLRYTSKVSNFCSKFANPSVFW